MARSTRQRILHGGSTQSTGDQSPSSFWYRFVKRRSSDEELHLPIDAAKTATKHHTSLSRTSSMNHNKSLTSTSGRAEGRNSSPNVGTRRSSNMQDLDIGSLPQRLEPFGESMMKLVQLLSEVHPTLSNVLTVCSEHKDEVDSMKGVLEENARLRAESKDQVKDIESLDHSLRMAHRMNDVEERNSAAAKQKLKEESDQLNRERETNSREFAEQKEIQKQELASKIEQLARNHEKQEESRKMDMEKQEKARETKMKNDITRAERDFERQKKEIEAGRVRAEKRAESGSTTARNFYAK